MKITKYVLALAFCTLVRLARIVPNFDPIMGTALPFAKQDKWWQAALFSAAAIVIFDILTGLVGIWTAITSLTYAALAAGFHFYYQNRKVGLKTYVGSGVAGVLVYDSVTGVVAGPVLFGGTYLEAFIGQIPFTLMHLAGVTIFVLLITPLLDKHLVQNPQLEDNALLSKLSLA